MIDLAEILLKNNIVELNENTVKQSKEKDANDTVEGHGRYICYLGVWRSISGKIYRHTFFYQILIT